jgi:hypothetical protein
MEGFLCVVRSMSTGALLLGRVWALFPMLRANRVDQPAMVEFSSGYRPAVVILEPADDPGPDPFTDSVAMEIDLDPALTALPLLNGDVFLSVHRRMSEADLVVAGGFGLDSARRGDGEGSVLLTVVDSLVAEYVAPDGHVTDPDDRNHDGRDDEDG